MVPVIVAIAIILWNSERTKQQTAAALTPLAISILTRAPSQEDNAALNDWAIAVMNSPANPPPLTQEVASEFASAELITPKLPNLVLESCRHPRKFLDESVNMEIIAGRLGDELIFCNQKRQLSVDAYLGVSAVLAPKIISD